MYDMYMIIVNVPNQPYICRYQQAMPSVSPRECRKNMISVHVRPSQVFQEFSFIHFDF